MQDDVASATRQSAQRGSGRVAQGGEPTDDLADNPTSSAYLKITTVGPTTVEARGTVPLICVSGILGAVAIAYIAAAYGPRGELIWFLGLAAIELVLAGLVILRVTRNDRRSPD
jgi:hypothetical protein